MNLNMNSDNWVSYIIGILFGVWFINMIIDMLFGIDIVDGILSIFRKKDE
jgi:hypothetical protein